MEKEQAPIVPEDIHLTAIDVISQKTDTEALKKEKKQQLNIGHKLMYNLNEERVKLGLAFSFDGSNEKNIAFFQIDFHFHISKLNNYYTLKDDGLPVFYGPMIATLLGICVSTARGIIFEKLQSAGVKNVIIPVVSPQKMLIPQQNKKI